MCHSQRLKNDMAKVHMLDRVKSIQSMEETLVLSCQSPKADCVLTRLIPITATTSRKTQTQILLTTIGSCSRQIGEREGAFHKQLLPFQLYINLRI